MWLVTICTCVFSQSDPKRFILKWKWGKGKMMLKKSNKSFAIFFLQNIILNFFSIPTYFVNSENYTLTMHNLKNEKVGYIPFVVISMVCGQVLTWTLTRPESLSISPSRADRREDFPDPT